MSLTHLAAALLMVTTWGTALSAGPLRGVQANPLCFDAIARCA